MKKAVLFSFFLAFLALSGVKAQNFQDLVQVGDTLIIAETENDTYRYLKVPRKNFIIKRGGIASMNSLRNRRAKVVSLHGQNGNYKVVLTPTKGKFFNTFKYLKGDLNKAIENGELLIPQKKNKDSLAR